MTKRIFFPLIAFSAIAPAQETSVINPAEWSRPNVMVEGMRAQSGEASRRRGASAASTARTCANARRMRGTGEQAAKLRRLRQLCAQAGY